MRFAPGLPAGAACAGQQPCWRLYACWAAQQRWQRPDCSENPYTRVSYQNFGGEYQIVKAKAYLVGDLRDLVWQDEYDYYSWTAGTVYQTPVDLTLEWVSDEAQQPFDTDYLGYYAYADTFTSAGGHTVNLLVDTAPGTAGSDLKPECAAVFVADGVRYTLSGHVTQQTMRAIVDSMSYA